MAGQVSRRRLGSGKGLNSRRSLLLIYSTVLISRRSTLHVAANANVTRTCTHTVRSSGQSVLHNVAALGYAHALLLLYSLLAFFAFALRNNVCRKFAFNQCLPVHALRGRAGTTALLHCALWTLEISGLLSLTMTCSPDSSDSLPFDSIFLFFINYTVRVYCLKFKVNDFGLFTWFWRLHSARQRNVLTI